MWRPAVGHLLQRVQRLRVEWESGLWWGHAFLFHFGGNVYGLRGDGDALAVPQFHLEPLVIAPCEKIVIYMNIVNKCNKWELNWDYLKSNTPISSQNRRYRALWNYNKYFKINFNTKFTYRKTILLTVWLKVIPSNRVLWN